MEEQRRPRGGCFCCSAVIIAALLMVIWNWLVPQFWPAAPHLSFWETLGAVVLLALVGAALRLFWR